MAIDIQNHLKMFAQAFVQERRRERWEEFLTTRPARVFKHSSDLLAHLEPGVYRREKDLSSICKPNTLGVFYDFHGEPKVVSFMDAQREGAGSDAIFSIDAGRFAIYFFHEGESYVCRANGI